MTATNQNPDSPRILAIPVVGFGRRLVAILIDGLLLGFFTFLLALVIGLVATLLGMFTYSSGESAPIDTLIVLSALTLSVLYYVGSWSKSGQTLGKTLVGVKIVSTDGTSISRGQAFLRYVGYMISGMAASLGFLWIAFDRKRQGWHDKIAGTIVIYSDSRFGAADAVEFVPSDTQRSWIWLVIWVVLALGLPALLFGSLWFLGPVINRTVFGILQGMR